MAIPTKPDIRQHVHAIIEALGFDPTHVAKLELDPKYAVVTSYALNDNGDRILGNDGKPLTTTTIIAVDHHREGR